MSYRFVKQTKHVHLNYAPVDTYAIVLYMDVTNTEAGMAALQAWTEGVLRCTLQLGGKFYLPYLRVYARLARVYSVSGWMGGWVWVCEQQRSRDTHWVRWAGWHLSLRSILI